MFVFDKSADLKFRGNTMWGGGQGQSGALLLRSSVIYLRAQGGPPGQGCPSSTANQWYRQYREAGESSVGVRIGFLEEEELTWAIKNGLSLPGLFQE